MPHTRAEPTRVTAYAGGRGQEAPRSFTTPTGHRRVSAIQARWIEQDGSGRRRRVFVVEADDDRTYRLWYAEEEGGWYCRLESLPPR